MSKSNETTTTTAKTIKEGDNSTDNFYEKCETTEEVKVEIKEDLDDSETKEENLEEIKNDNLYEEDTEEINPEIKEENSDYVEIKEEYLQDVKMKKEVKDTLEENIDTVISTGALDLAGNINEL